MIAVIFIDGKDVFEIVDGWYPNKQYIDHLGSKHKKKVPAAGVEPTGDAKTPVRTVTQNRNNVNNNTQEIEKVKSDEINRLVMQTGAEKIKEKHSIEEDAAATNPKW